MNLHPSPQGTAPALTLPLLPSGGQELWCHEEPHELAVLLRRLHRSGAPGPVARASGSGHCVQRETPGRHPCPTPNPDPRARRAGVGPRKVPEGEALRRLHGLGQGSLLCRGQRSPVYRWCCVLLPGRPSHMGRGRGHGWLSLLPWPPRAGATLEATGEQGSWAGQEGGLDPPGPALCSVAHGSQGLPCLPSPKLLDRIPPPCMKAPSSRQARRGHRERRKRLPGALTPLCPAQPRLCLWSGRGPGRERSQVRLSVVLQGSSSGDWLEAVWLWGRLGDSMGSILAPPVPWWPEEGGPVPLPVLPCGASGAGEQMKRVTQPSDRCPAAVGQLCWSSCVSLFAWHSQGVRLVKNTAPAQSWPLGSPACGSALGFTAQVSVIRPPPPPGSPGVVVACPSDPAEGPLPSS